MEPFSISCTTCHARLKVRHAGAIGQILPCPKCGSMVLVEQPAGPADTGGSTESAGAATAATATPMIAAGSFDVIEQLLDDAPPKQAKVDDRWRGSESAPEDSESELADTKGDSIAQDETVEPDFASESVSRTADWLSSSVVVARRHAVLIGGLAIGGGIAVTVAGYLLLRPGSVTHKAPLVPEPVAVAEEVVDDTNRVTRPTEASDSTEVKADRPTPEVDPEEVEVVPEDEPPSDPEPAEPADEPAVAATNTVETPPQPEPPSPTMKNSSLIDLGDDGLAGFAQWLQNTEAAPPDRPKAAMPTSDEVTPPPAARNVPRQTRPIPEKVDVESRLKDQLIALEFKNVTLNNALRTLSAFSTIPISIDPDALGRRNLTADHEVDLLVRDESTVADVLSQMLGKLRLDYYVADGHLFVSTPAECQAEFVTLQHDVSDLANGGQEKTKEFGEWVQQLVAQGTWSTQGGRGECRAVGSKLEITHFDTVHYQVLVFCERLRLVRGQKPITRLRPEHSQPGPRANSLRAAGTPVTLKVWRESNLESIAVALERAAEIQVLIDWHALHSAGWSPQDTMTFFCSDQRLEQALTSLLEPMGLTYRVINPITIQISTFEALEAQHEVEFYPLPAKATNDDVQQISRRIMQRIGQAKFQPAGRGAIGFDTNSRSLIVSLPQHDQVVVHAMLSGNGTERQ